MFVSAYSRILPGKICCVCICCYLKPLGDVLLLPSVSQFYQSESSICAQFFLNRGPSMNEKKLDQCLEKSTTVSKFDSK